MRSLNLFSFWQCVCAFLFCAFCHSNLSAQITLKGTIVDQVTNETLIGASVVVKGTSKGSVTDIDGKFEIVIDNKLPVTLQVSYIGYVAQEFVVNKVEEKLRFKLSSDEVLIKEVEVVGERIDERQKQAALTVETMDVIAIKEAPSGNFYEGLGNLKGVDITSPSLGFKIINTRGFNSTSPVRSLQLIDGVDNQSPGLNFSLGNFLGASDLDVMKVDIIAGASSAFYGPGAFNGVISMTTKSPFVFKGLTAEMKVGERNLYQIAVRYADVFKNKAGEDKLGYKINLLYMQANDWEANNASAVEGLPVGENNPGGYDAVNRYGDEDLVGGNDFTQTNNQRLNSPGLGIFYRTGYWEEDLIDYRTDNLKSNLGVYYKITPKTELSYNFNFSTGSTVYQGDNRYRLDDVLFFQNKIEWKQDDKFFIRAYATHEDAGKSYDAVVTAFTMQEEAKLTTNWNTGYSQYWNQTIKPLIVNSQGYQDLQAQYPQPTAVSFISQVPAVYATIDEALAAFSAAYSAWITPFNDAVEDWLNSGVVIDGVPIWDPQSGTFITGSTDISGLHELSARANADYSTNLTSQNPRYEPGTPEFDAAFRDVTGRTFTEGGSRFYDKSALYHVHGEYKFKPAFADIIVGANGRLYTPDTRGTIFSDTLQYTRSVNGEGEIVKTDSSYRRITNYEFGAYLGLERKFMDEKLKANASGRLDKNQNFDFLFSPALSLVYTPDINHNIRVSFSSAIRNPTLADQYLYYDVGRAILLGNISGYDSLVTVDSFREYINTPSLNEGISKLEYFDLDPVVPEKVKTIELGYRTTLFNRVYMDLGYYHSWYRDFIGYVLGVDLEYDPTNGFPTEVQAYRIASNSQDMVTTQGLAIGLNYYFKIYTLNFNYSWNRLDLRNSEDPIIPAFNTPEHKFNLGINARELKLFNIPNWGFSANYKWIDGFVFEGSPQFTGSIPSYDMFDAQINLKIPKWKSTFKVGASNIFGLSPLFDGRGDGLSRMFNNDVIQVYGGPFVGRMAYFSILFELDKK
jgi:iron complex outermembrane recepter protein